MLSFNEFRKVVISEADDKKVEDELLSVIDQLIDSWISSIKNDILTGAQSFAASRGLWDRFKNFISRSYVHHVGSQTVGTNYAQLNAAAMPWLEENRPQYIKKWFQRVK